MILSAMSVVGLVLDIILLIASAVLLGWSAYRLVIAIKKRKAERAGSKKKGNG